MSHPSLEPFKSSDKSDNLKELLEKAKQTISDVQVPIKSLSLVDIDKLSETMTNAKTVVQDTVSMFNEYLQIQMQRTNLSDKDIEHTRSIVEQTTTKIDNLTAILTDIHTFLSKLTVNAQKESEVLDLLKKELTK